MINRYIIVFVLMLAGIFHLQAQNFLPIKMNNKWGFIDSTGKVLIEPKYSHVGEFYKNSCNVCEGYNCGLLNSKGELLVPIQFQSVKVLNDSIYLVCSKEQKYGIYNSKLASIQFFGSITVVYGSVGELLMNDDSLDFSFIYKDTSYIKIPKSKSIYKLKNYYVNKENVERLVLNKNGEVVLKMDFDEVINPIDSIFILRKKGLEALYVSGEKVLDFEFTEITLTDAKRQVFKVSKRTLYGMYNLEKRDFILEPKYREIKEVEVNSELMFVLTESNDDVNIITLNKDTVAKAISSTYRFLSERAVCFKYGNQWRVTSIKYGLLSQDFDDVTLENAGFCLVTVGDKLGLVNKYGALSIPPLYKDFARAGFLIKATKFNGETELFNVDSKFNVTKKNSYKKFTTLQIGGTGGEEEDFSRFEFTKAKASDFERTITEKELKKLEERYATTSKIPKALFDNQKRRSITDNLFSYVDLDPLNNGAKYARVLFQSGRMGLVNVKGQIIANSDFKLDPKSEKITVKPFCYISEFDANGLAMFSVDMSMSRSPSFTSGLFDLSSYLRFASNGTWGLMNDEGKIIVQPCFTKIQIYSSKEIIAKNKQGNFGVLSLKGDTILPFEFSEIKEIKQSGVIYYSVQKSHEMWEVFDLEGQALSTARFNQVGIPNQGVLPVRENYKWTAIDQQGHRFSDPIYERTGEFNNGVLPVRLNNQWGAINSSGDTVIDFKYSVLGEYENSVMIAKQKSRYGLIDINQKWVVKPNYVKMMDNENGLIITKKKALWGVLNTDGKWVIKPRFKDVDLMDSLHYKVRSVFGYRYKIYTIQGKPMTKRAYSYVEILNEKEFITVTKDRKDALLNSKGKKVVDFGQFYDFKYLGGDLFKARKANLWYVIDTTGKALFSEKGFDNVGNVSNNRISLYDKKQGTWSVLTLNGDTISKSKYEVNLKRYGLTPVSSQILSFVDNNGRVFFSKPNALFVGSESNVIVLKRFLYTRETRNRLGPVTEHIYGYALLNKFGMELSDYIFSDYKLFNEGFVAFKTESFIGVYDSNFQTVVEPKFEQLNFLQNDILKVSGAGQLGYFNLKTGSWIWEVKE